MEIREIEFEKLRLAYITIKTFLEDHSGEKVTSLKTKVAEDLSLYGDDNYELLEDFITKFELEYKNFEYGKHFQSEGELFGSGAALENLLKLSVWLPLKTLEVLTFNKVKIDKPEFLTTPSRQVSDLTFRELLTWYLEKEYRPDSTVRYMIKPVSS